MKTVNKKHKIWQEYSKPYRERNAYTQPNTQRSRNASKTVLNAAATQAAYDP